jgi:eukaryotic-like serine/threonine-protein kinase
MKGAFLNVEESRQHIMKCPYCDTYNPPTEEYCTNCGGYLGSSPAAATITSSNVPGLGTTSAGSAGQVTSSTTAGGTHTTSGSLAPGGHLQGGRYVIKKILGQGGMGAAVLANDMRVAGKPVVIKELISDNTDPTQLNEDVKNFEREVETLAYIDHPLVPTVTDHFQEGSHYFMVQEFVDGENLEDRLDRTGQPLPEQDALTYASQVLDILDYLEQQKPPIVHRDIKPANIIIGSKDKRAHLVDFGIARADTARNVKRKQTSALGTPGYAPPEQYQGNADPRSDLYALAATLHHLLTNRDPRNEPPFAYPPVRALNPRLSPETERVLDHALKVDINQRYQSAAAMKQDIDEILQNRYATSAGTGSYSFSGPIVTPGAASTIARQPVRPIQARPMQQQAQAQRPVNPPPPRPVAPPPSPYPFNVRPPQGPPSPQTTGHVARNFILFVLAILLISAVAYFAFLRGPASGLGPASTPGATTSAPPPAASGIGVTKAPNGEFIGISDGTFAFDTNRPDGTLKRQAADKLKGNDVGGAQSLWQSGLRQDTSDAEALIYLEDQRVLSSGNPYITIVVGTMLTGDSAGVGRDDLQGAYIAQKEFNDGHKLPNSVQVRLLVASSGSDATYATTVAQQIVLAAQQDHTVVGVMGWPYSSRAINAVPVLARAHIPMVSQTASSDQLTGISSYFFRVAPSNKGQGIAGAHYAEQVLRAKNVALFVDPADSYSSSLAADFSQQFKSDGNTIVITENYTVGSKGQGQLPGLLQDALSHNPDLVYFSGYASDISVLLANLPTSGPEANIQILGGDALYELSGYSTSGRANFSRLHFTSFAYPDEWEIAGLKAQKPAFFTNYANAFNPNGQQPSGAYGYARASSDVMLSYDATLALLAGSGRALSSVGANKNITPADLQQALTQIKGAQSVQGVSGPIAFDTNGDPVNKPFVILAVDPQGRIHQESLLGRLLVGS